MCAHPDCDGQLRVTHTYTRGSEKFQRAVCSDCGRIHRVASLATLVTARGEGAKAHAARAERAQCDASSPSF